MKASIAIASLVITVSVNAQVYKCNVDGKVVYSDVRCPDAREVDPAKLRANTLSTTPLPNQRRPAPPPQPAPYPESARATNPQRQQLATVCPSEREILNLETSAKSVTLREEERDFLLAEIRRARACRKEGGNYTADDWKSIKENQAGQNRIDENDRRRERELAEGRHAPSASDRENERMRNDKLREAVENSNRRSNFSGSPPFFGCNASGCSGNDGWYTRAGPNLIGPNGQVCVGTGGGMYHCN